MALEVNPHNQWMSGNLCWVRSAGFQIAPWIAFGMVSCVYQKCIEVTHLHGGQWHALVAWDNCVHVLLQVRIQILKHEVQNGLILFVDVFHREQSAIRIEEPPSFAVSGAIMKHLF